jgi:hypothetical protein
MAYNANQAFSQSLTLFSSLYLDANPTDLPMGLSPDNADVWFLPGSVSTRPALSRLFSSVGEQSITSIADYPLTTDQFQTVFLDSSGALRQNNGTSTAFLTQVASGAMFKAENAFQKQWYAFFNGDDAVSQGLSPFVGVDVPRYYDGDNVWKVTYDAPGISPTFSNYQPAAATIAVAGGPASVNVTTIVTSDPDDIPYGRYGDITIYLTATVTTATPHGFSAGTQVTLAGNSGTSQFNGTFIITQVLSANVFKYNLSPVPHSFSSGGGGTATATISGTSIVRSGNTVTAYTNAAHDFKPGWYVVISGFSAVATGGAANATQSNGIVTVTTATAHGLSPGSTVIIAGMGDATYNGTFTVIACPSSTTFTYAQTTTAASTGPGTVSSPFNGTFQISSVPTTTSFQYANIGPDQSSNATGTATPQSQVVQGPRQAVCMFKSQNGAITGPSIPVSLSGAGGSNFLVAQGVPIGPAGTAQRVIAFTPAYGSNWYYLAPAVIPATAGGVPVYSNGTIIPDNTSTSAILDFSDAQLTAGVQIDIAGNNLFNQVLLGPCLGVIEYQQRLFWWGEANNIKNFINMSFDGGYVGTLSGAPLGWDTSGSTGGTGNIVEATYPPLGFAYRMISAGGAKDCLIEQGAFEDYYGAPILQTNTLYKVSFAATATMPASAGNFVCELYSPISGVVATAQGSPVAFFQHPGIQTLTFNAKTPGNIPSDTLLRIYLNGVNAGNTIVIDEVALVNADQPVLNNQARVSYLANPFGYDGVTGLVGFDTVEFMVGAFKQRGFLYFITDESLYQTQNNGVTEPSGWTTDFVSGNCGCSSPNAVDPGQSEAKWAGFHGVQLFDGGTPIKASQELQPLWETINWNRQTRIWLENDPIQRVNYIGVPVNLSGTPTLVLPMSYRAVNKTYEVPEPLHISQFSGRLLATDLARKWTKWRLTLNCGAMVHRNSVPQMVFGSGNGLNANTGQGFGSLYELDFSKYTDDDYGQIFSYYTTFFFFSHEVEDSVPQVGSHRKLFAYQTAQLTGVGVIQITPYVNSIDTPWAPIDSNGVPIVFQYPLAQIVDHDLDFSQNFVADRAAFKFEVFPLPGETDSFFQLQQLDVSGRADSIFPVRGTVF